MENKDKLSNKNIDKKKVGIMTWFNGCNYGTILQAKALQHVICKLGNEADIINYKKRNYKNREIKKISSLFCRLKNKIFYDRINNTSKFNDFRDKYLKLTESCNTFVELNDLNSKYDVFVCGSDQIWSPFSFDEKYFLNFTTKDKKVAYAPSFGVSKISNLYVYNKIKNLLSDFKYISVREKQGQKIIKELTNQDAQLVLDPTLLLDYEDWKIYENKEILNKINDKYVLCYFLGKSNSYYKKIVNFAKKNNYQIINIPIFKRQKFNKFNISNVGPSEFLSLFKNAEYIFTDSLHGTLFSLNFRKRFFIFKRFNDKADYSENSRIYNIIELFNLHDRVIDEKDNIIEKDINYKIFLKN